MKRKRIVGFLTAFAMILSAAAPMCVSAETVVETAVEADALFGTSEYVCDFTQLVKDGADTTYGTSDDVIALDDYTTAYLTYEGTYVSADGVIYLMGANTGKGAYTKGSYIEFTAPSDGTVSLVCNYVNLFVNGTYNSYPSGTKTLEMTAGQKIQIGERTNNRSTLTSLAFTPAQVEETEEPTEAPETEIPEYTSPGTTWDFDSYSPASSGENVPVMSGNAECTDGEIKFPSGTTTAGYLTVDMAKSIKNNVKVSVDVTGHTKALGQQYFNIIISNSEEEIVNIQHHGYDDSYGNGIYVCGEQVATNKDIRASISSNGTTNVAVSIDYTARKATITLGSKTITGDIPEGTVSDISRLEISSTRSKVAAERYISVDNIGITEFTSSDTPADVTVTDGYTKETIAGYTCQTKAQTSKPAVIYLASELRSGTDGYSQLYDAKYIFDKLADSAALIAPQSADEFTDVTALVSEVKSKYSATSVTVIGQSQSAAAALTSGADKIITIAGAASNPTAPSGKAWVFSGYEDDTTAVGDVKTMVNALQKAGADVRYTEYPYGGHKINDTVAEEAGIIEWITGDVSDSNTVDLAIFMGQSNMAGRGDWDEAAVCEAGHGYEFKNISGDAVLTSVSEPFGKYENNDAINDSGSNGKDRRSGDMVSAFMESYYETAGVPLVGVQASRGGTAVKYWNTETQKTEAQQRLSDAKTYLTECGYTIGKIFMVWCQGEADADSNSYGDTYKNSTKAVFEYMQAVGVTDMMIVKTGHYNRNYGLDDGDAPSLDALAHDARYQRTNAAQAEIANENNNITEVASFFTDESFALMRDQYHYYQPAYTSVGQMAGNNAAVALYGTGTAQDVPQSKPTIENYEISPSMLDGTGASGKITVTSVTDSQGGDKTEGASISDFASSDTDVIDVTSDGTITANGTGTAAITFTLTADGCDAPIKVKKQISVFEEGTFELTSSDSQIDVSGMRNYGTSVYRVYQDKSYTDVEAADGEITNPYSGEVTVVPVYRFNYTSADIDGYTTATGTYSADNGYGALSGGNYNVNANGSLPTDTYPLHVDLAPGEYDINVFRQGGTRADVFNDGVQIINNTTSYGSDNRPSGSGLMHAPQIEITDGSMDLTVKNTSGSNERIATVEIVKVPEKYRKSIVWVAGDSESANYYPINADGDDLDSEKRMMTGFGMQLDKYLSSDDYKVANWGQPSATAKTWSDECLESVKSRMKAGDTILICFGINDAVNSTYKVSYEQMLTDLTEIIDAAKDKNAEPILLSPVYNQKYDGKQYFKYDGTTNDMYAFAEEQGIACIDLNKGMRAYKDKAIEDTGDGAWVVNNYHVIDVLHMTQHTACMAAAIIACGMEKLGYAVSDYSVTFADRAEPETSSDNSSYSLYGTKTGVTREYSVAALADYVTVYNFEKAEITYDDGKVTVTANDTDKAVLIKAAYEEGVMKKIDTYDAEFADGKFETELTLDEGDVLYLWDSLEGMKPLTEKYVYGGGTQSPTAAPTATPTATPTAAPTTAPTATPTAAPTAIPSPTEEAKVMLYSDDFEDETAGGNGGWTSPAGKMEIKTDTENGLGNYQTVVSGKSGTCRSGYIEIAAVTENFVFECDYKSSGNVNVSDLELLSSKSAVYSNHGVYSTGAFAFTMARPKNSDCYVINNKTDDSGLQISGYTDPVFASADISGNPWIHVKVVGDYDTQTAAVTLTSLDGETEYLKGVYDMNVGRDSKITSWKCIHLLSPSSGVDTCIDNIEVYKARECDFENYHNVNITCMASSFNQYVIDGKTVVNIPDTSAYGDYFEGWKIGDTLYSTEELAELPITSDMTVTAQISEDYIEPLASVEFASFPAGSMLAAGEDENTYGSNEISLKITGEQGTSLVTDPDSRVTDYAIDWTFDGFRILDGNPTGETGDVYCDSYGLVEITDTAQSSVDFKLKRTAANYYGTVSAKVTYNGKTAEVSQPLVYIGSKTENGIFPTAGYTADYNKYDSALAGYSFTDENVLFGGNWEIAGSDASRMTFMSDDDGNYIRYSRDTKGNSAYGNLKIGAIESQTMFTHELRFNNTGSVAYDCGASTTVSGTAFTLNFDGSAFSFNGTKVCSASKETWYKVEICADPTSMKTWARVYDTSDNLLGESDVVSFNDSTYAGGVYYRILPARVSNSSIDFNNLNIYEDEIDTSAISVTTPESVTIPESGQTTAQLSFTAKTVSGETAIGAAQWAVDDEFAAGVTIEASDCDTATLTVDSSAGSGDVPIRCTIGGKSAVVNVKLIGTKNSVAFTEAQTGIRLTGTDGEYNFKAEVRDGSGNTTEGEVVYALYDETNTSAVSPDGVSIDADTGTLTVSASAEPQVIGIRASSADASKFIKVTLYDLKFAFGDTIGDGYTDGNVTYSDSRGYGFDGTTFKVKLESGSVYSVAAEHDGTLVCEKIDSSLSGYETTAASFKTAVFGDGIMDITPKGSTTLTSITLERAERTESEKPQWWTIGDSTVQQNGSWGYTIASSSTTDLSKYSELADVCSAFYNSGKAGDNHKSYYAAGRLNSILSKMNPGDVVSLSGMGTNDSSSSQEEFYAYDKAYVDAILDMGGYVILGSYTPTGNYGSTKGKVYNADTMTFTGMRTNSYELAIRELYEDYKDNDHVLGFLDIGKFSDELMTADVKAVYDAAIADGSTETEAKAAASERAEEMMAWWKDYNHYYVTFSNYILPTLTKNVAELIAPTLK